MYRDTTPELIFNIPFETDLITDAGVTVSQNDKEIVTKPLSDLILEGKTVTAKLSRADTRALDAEEAAEIQLWVLAGEESLQSKIFREPVERILKEWGGLT